MSADTPKIGEQVGPPVVDPDPRAEFADQLSGLAADLQEVSAWFGRVWTDAMPAPRLTAYYDQGAGTSRPAVTFWAGSGEQFALLVRALATGAPKGAVEKSPDGEYMDAVRMFGTVKVRVSTPRRNVCERRQVGVETVMEPDPNAPLVEVERPIWEYDCGESILAGRSQ